MKAIRLMIAPALLAIAACSTTSETTLPDGSVAYRIDCGGSARGMNYCFEKAGKSCGADGFRIVDPTGRTLGEGSVADTDPSALTRAFETDTNSILIQCRG